MYAPTVPIYQQFFHMAHPIIGIIFQLLCFLWEEEYVYLALTWKYTAYMKLNYECLRNCVWCGPQQAVSNALTARRYGQNVQVRNIPYYLYSRHVNIAGHRHWVN